MSKQNQAANPFYAVLVMVGILFVITTCGYAVMSVRESQQQADLDRSEDHGLMWFMKEHGFTALMIELAILALATMAAIGTDEYWMRRAQSVESRPSPGKTRNLSNGNVVTGSDLSGADGSESNAIDVGTAAEMDRKSE